MTTPAVEAARQALAAKIANGPRYFTDEDGCPWPLVEDPMVTHLRAVLLALTAQAERLAEVERERERDARTDADCRRAYAAELGIDDPEDSPACWDEIVDVAREARASVVALTAERDKARENVKRERERRDFTEAWYATRIERLATLAKERGLWNEVSAILANGSEGPHDPPTYAQLLQWATVRRDTAERELEAIRVRSTKACAGTGLSPANAGVVPQIVEILVGRLDAALARVAELEALLAKTP